MQKLTLLLFTFFSVSAFAQSDKLLLGITASPDLCYRTLKNNDGSTTADWIIDNRNEKESPKFGYSAGASVCFNLSQRIGIETGLQYSNKGELFTNDDFKSGDQLYPLYGFGYGENSAITRLRIRYDYHYLDIPLRAVFSFGHQKFRFISGIGFTANVLMFATQKTEVTFENGQTLTDKSDQYRSFRRLNLTPTVSAGIEYRFNNRMYLRVEPVFRYGLIGITSTSVTANLWSAGVMITSYFPL